MVQQVNKDFKSLFIEHPRYFILMGGRGAGRSTVASQFAIARLRDPEYFRCAIMRYVWSDIRESIYKEITDRVDENNLEDEIKINDSTMLLEYEKNSIKAVGFKKSSEGRKAKLKSLASYNYVIIEEADEVPEEDFMQLDDSLRTVKGNITIILLLNPPPKNHWIIKRWFDLDKSEKQGYFIPRLKNGLTDTMAICNDYHSNEKNIAPASIVQYEAYKDSKPDHYYNLIKGYVPETVIGRIYNFIEIDELPADARLRRRGLDYGYTNDPTGIVDVYSWNNSYIWDEICYRKGMSNKEIADVIKLHEDVLTIADSAEPKSNDELLLYGVSVQPSQKGPGSVNQGIQYVQAQTIYYTKRSIHIKEEQENYAWMIDKKTGETINTPIDMWNHILDAGRYAMESLKPYESNHGIIDESQPLASL